MNAVAWLEANDRLAGWAQFAGAMLALIATYFTAFVPIWNRKRQLRKAARRLLMHSYEVLESYHRTTPKFLPSSLTLKGGALAFGVIIDEISRFPIYELDDQGSRSLARHLVAVNANLLSTRLVFEDLALRTVGRDATPEERDDLTNFLLERLEQVRAVIAGKELTRPLWTGVQTIPD